MNNADKRKDWDPAELARSASLVACAARYLRDLAVLNYSQVTIKAAQSALRIFIEWLLERDVRDTTDVTRIMLERYQRYLFHFRKAKDGEPLAISTQQQRIRLLKGFFSWAVKKHLVPANPAADLEYPRPIHTIPHTLNIEQIQNILNQPDLRTPVGVRDRAILEVLYSTGLRRMEICNLRVDDIDWQGGALRVTQGKGKKDRRVPIGARALGWLRLYVDHVRHDMLRDMTQMLLFVSRTGERSQVTVLGTAVRRYVQATGITKPGACHLFRHSMATHLLDNGADVRYIQEILGHENLNTTARYTHVSIERLKAVHSACHPGERLNHAENAQESMAALEAADAVPEADTDTQPDSDPDAATE